jgi:DNA-binding response OmpR family regulator
MATVLVVDDDRNSLHRLVLEAQGFHVLAAHDAEGALARARAHVPDVIVTDCMTPDMEGVELCQTLKAHLSSMRIPIIMLTAPPMLPSAADTSWDALLLKPVSVAALLSAIAALARPTGPTEPDEWLERVGIGSEEPVDTTVRAATVFSCSPAAKSVPGIKGSCVYGIAHGSSA